MIVLLDTSNDLTMTLLLALGIYLVALVTGFLAGPSVKAWLFKAVERAVVFEMVFKVAGYVNPPRWWSIASILLGGFYMGMKVRRELFGQQLPGAVAVGNVAGQPVADNNRAYLEDRRRG